MTGRFVWHELFTTDTKGAIAFYTEVIGWKTEDFPGAQGPDPYVMWKSSQGTMGGVMALPEQAKQMGAPPHWMGHIGVDDVDATVAHATKLGGQIHMPPTDIPTVGRFAVIADPQGAAFSVFASEGDMPPHDTSKPGEIAWNELISTDAVAGLKFYQALLGWKVLDEMDMGPAGKYVLFGPGEQSIGAMMTKTPDMKMPGSAWIYYIQVDDLAGTVARAKSKRAQVLIESMEVPGGAIAQLIDPQGVHFALHASRAN